MQEQREMAFVKKEDKTGVCRCSFWFYKPERGFASLLVDVN